MYDDFSEFHSYGDFKACVLDMSVWFLCFHADGEFDYSIVKADPDFGLKVGYPEFSGNVIDLPESWEAVY